MVSISTIETPPFLLPRRYNNTLSMLSVLYNNMFLLLSCYNSSWSMVSISTIETMAFLLPCRFNNIWNMDPVCNIENNVPSVVMMLLQQLKHGLY